MNAPKITGNTFCNSAGGISPGHRDRVAPRRARHSSAGHRQHVPPDRHAAGQRQPPQPGHHRRQDPRRHGGHSSPWTYREAFYGGAGTVWPVTGDGWLKNTGGSSADWQRSTIGIAKGGSGTAISYMYRDLGSCGSM
jgi:hypothetical protein